MYQSISLLPNTIYCIHLSFLTSDRETTIWSITKTHTQWTPERVWGKWYNCSALPCFPPRAVAQGCYKLPLKAHLTGLHSNTEAQKRRHIPYIFFSTTRPKLFLQFVQWQAAIKMGQKESLTNCTQSNCDLLVLLDWTWLLCTRPRSPVLSLPRPCLWRLPLPQPGSGSATEEKGKRRDSSSTWPSGTGSFSFQKVRK